MATEERNSSRTSRSWRKYRRKDIKDARTEKIQPMIAEPNNKSKNCPKDSIIELADTGCSLNTRKVLYENHRGKKDGMTREFEEEEKVIKKTIERGEIRVGIIGKSNECTDIGLCMLHHSKQILQIQRDIKQGIRQEQRRCWARRQCLLRTYLLRT